MLHIIKINRLKFISSLVLLIIGTYSTMLSPLFFKKFLEEQELYSAIVNLFFTILVLSISALSLYWSYILQQILSRDSRIYLREKCFKHILFLKDDIDIVCGSFEFCLNSVGGFLAGSINKIYKCRLFAAGYIFSASSPPYSCTAAKDSFEKIEKKGKKMKESLDKIKKEFRKKMERVEKVEIIGNKESSCLLLKTEDVDRMIDILRENGFYVVKQHHLKEDWCQNRLIKINLGIWFDSQTIDKIVDVFIKN